jgi:hypothetical protein
MMIDTLNLLVLLTVYAHSHIVSGTSNNFYIVNSPDNHCRRELTADEPCLTLQQYAYSPSLGSNASVSLMVESGTHLLQGVGVKFDSESDFGIPTGDFNMTGESVKIVYDSFGTHYYSPIVSVRNARYVSIHGVTFVSNNRGYVKIEHVQNLFIEHCTFQGVRLYISNVMFDNWAMILMSSFFDYSHRGYSYTDSGRDYGAISISNSLVYIIQSNFSANKGAIHYHDINGEIDLDPSVLVVYRCIFSNNTSKYGGSSVHVDGSATLAVHDSNFLFNTASGSGGAIYYSGTAALEIKASTFVYNNANFCGAVSVEKYSKYIEISNSTFYYNRAVNIGGDGGAVCVRNASVSINNSTFVANAAIGDAGALQAEESNVTISGSIFSNNSAQRDGGALFTLAHPSNYTITNTILTHNKAGDDGGAVFVGRKGSHLKMERSSLVNNLASDRGGAMAIFGSTLDVKQTNIYDNSAHLGKALSACNSFIGTYLPGKGDQNFPTCTLYDEDLAPSDAPPFHDGSYSDVTWLNNTVTNILTLYLIESGGDNPVTSNATTANAPDSQLQKLRQTSIISYASLAISAVTLIFLLLCITFSKATRCKCKIRHKNRGYRLLSSFHDQPDDDDEELLDPSK